MHCLVCPADCLFAVKALFGLSSPQRAQTTKSKSVELSSGLRPKSITQSTRPYRDLSNWGDELNAWYWYRYDTAANVLITGSPLTSKREEGAWEKDADIPHYKSTKVQQKVKMGLYLLWNNLIRHYQSTIRSHFTIISTHTQRWNSTDISQSRGYKTCIGVTHCFLC
ncbi:Murein transglycosylase [Fusarium oxysporum f. sp. albedinis]|nr:Murein transglycosylase [Fusarium oxysporum f. sp. albedinis]